MDRLSKAFFKSLLAAGILTLAGLSPAVAEPKSGEPAPIRSGGASSPSLPRFRFETDWLKLPPEVALGEITSIAVDRKDHIWLLHRPGTVNDADKSKTAAPVVEFDVDGRYLRSFGGPGPGYEWPSMEHSLAVSANGQVWISGNGGTAGQGDDMLLVFDRDGRFVRQVGHRGASRGNLDKSNFSRPADIFVDDRAHEVYVADGYGNRRIVVLDTRDGRFLRTWGAFGALPAEVKDGASEPAGKYGPHSFNGVHGVEKSADGLVYVSDRMNQRIQVFTASGRYIRQAFVNRGLASPVTVSGITFSRDPKQRLLFVADWGNGMIVVMNRATMQVVGTIGGQGNSPGQFKGPHLIDIDRRGVIYVAEVQGRRLQRMIPCKDDCGP